MVNLTTRVFMFKSGKHAGKLITDSAIADSFLEFLLKSPTIKPHFADILRAELDRRTAGGKPADPEPVNIVPGGVARGLVDSELVREIVEAVTAVLQKRGEL